MFRQPSLPYHDSFGKNEAAEWTSYGGDWRLQDGSVINRSDESGAKIVTGSSRWKNYEIEADLKLDGHDGDVGLIARVSDEEHGADSYNGYYVGLRSMDSALVIGRADHGWLEGRPVSLPYDLKIGVWYHLQVVLVGCRIGARATNLLTGQTAVAAFEEEPCATKGKIGLRSMATGGMWRNVQVKTTTEQSLADIWARASFVSKPIYPVREDAYDHMRQTYFPTTFFPDRGHLQPPGQSYPEPISIAAARSAPPPETLLTLRGVVTLTSPYYIQDDTGGVMIRLSVPRALNLGDEVEVVGYLGGSGVSESFQVTILNLLGDRTLVAPISVTSTQAAGGAFDSRLVEVRGTLMTKRNRGDHIELQLSDADQAFYVLGGGDLSLRKFKSLVPGSELRVRGICLVGAEQHLRPGTFTVLLRSLDDVMVLSGPPWWSAQILPRYILLLLLILAGGVYLYVRVERSMMRAVLEERERIAYTMHDTLAQSFAGVGFQLQGLRNSIRSGQLQPLATLEKLDVACDLVMHTHREASAEIEALHPDYTESTDILTALQRSTQGPIDTGLPWMELTREGTPRTLSMATRDALFQIGREAISNILRHSAATETHLHLCYEPRHVVLIVQDNGRGFSYPDHADSFGLRGMRHRASRVNGVVSVNTTIGEGTSVRVEVPYRVGLHLMRRLNMRLSARRRTPIDSQA